MEVILPAEVKEGYDPTPETPATEQESLQVCKYTVAPRVTIPLDMANKATLSLYSSIAQCNMATVTTRNWMEMGPTIEASSTTQVKNTIN